MVIGSELRTCFRGNEFRHRSELVPHLFDVTNNRPTGQRGWFAWARVGADSIVDNAFRLLQNQ